MLRSIRSIALALLAAASFLIPSAVSAATITNVPVPGQLSNFHREVIITMAPGEIVYLPMPIQNAPVRVELVVTTATRGPTDYGSIVSTFMVTDFTYPNGTSYPAMSWPTEIYGGGNSPSATVTPCASGDPYVAPFYTATNAATAFALSGSYCYLSPPPTNPGMYTNSVVVGVTIPPVGQNALVLFGVVNPDPGNTAAVTFRVHAWW